jgi:hypothetical protein
VSLPRWPKIRSFPAPPSIVWLPTPPKQPPLHSWAAAATGAEMIVSLPPPASTFATEAGTTMRSAHGVPRIVPPLRTGPSAQLAAADSPAAGAPGGRQSSPARAASAARGIQRLGESVIPL